MKSETSTDKSNMRIRAVYVSGRSDLCLRISLTECIMSGSSVNTGLQKSRSSNQSVCSHLNSVHFTFEERDFGVSIVARTRTNVR